MEGPPLGGAARRASSESAITPSEGPGTDDRSERPGATRRERAARGTGDRAVGAPRPRAGRPPRARGAPRARLPLRARPHRARLPVLDPGPLGVDRRRLVLRPLRLPDHGHPVRLQEEDKPRFFLNFYARRTVRIFPLYYAVLLALCLFLTMPAARPEAAKLAAPAWYYFYSYNIYVLIHNGQGPLRLPRPLLEPVRRGAVLPRLAVPRLQPAGPPASRRHCCATLGLAVVDEAAARRRRRRLGADLRQHAHADRAPSRSARSAPAPRRTGSAAAESAKRLNRPGRRQSPCWSSPIGAVYEALPDQLPPTHAPDRDPGRRPPVRPRRLPPRLLDPAPARPAPAVRDPVASAARRHLPATASASTTRSSSCC